MPEKERTSKRNQNSTGDEAEALTGIGELLKRGREEKGLSREQVSEMTRLRVHILKALESKKDLSKAVLDDLTKLFD